MYSVKTSTAKSFWDTQLFSGFTDHGSPNRLRIRVRTEEKGDEWILYNNRAEAAVLQIILPAHGYFEAENNTRSLIDDAPHCTTSLVFCSFDFREILFRLDSL
jgi:hypothetical protein